MLPVILESEINYSTLLKPVMDAITAAITPAQMVAILASVITAGVGFVLMWFGFRYLKGTFFKAVTRGKI